MRKLLPEGTTVILKNTGTPELDGQMGVVRGIVSEVGPFGSTYIIEFASILSTVYPYTCRAFTEVCLDVPELMERGCGSCPCACSGYCEDMVPQNETVTRQRAAAKRPLIKTSIDQN